MKIKIQDLALYIPFAAAFVILLSSVRLITIYSAYKINIVDYMSLSEFTLSFVDDLFFYAALFSRTIFIPICLVMLLCKSRLFRKHIFSFDPVEIKIIMERYAISVITTIIILMLIIKSVKSCIGSHSIYAFYYFLLNVSFSVVNFMVFSFLYSRGKNFYFKINEYTNLFLLYILTPTIIVLTFVRAKYKVSGNYENLLYENVTSVICYEGNEVSSSSTNFYIGKTLSHTFFFNTETRTSTVYPNDRISKFYFINKSQNKNNE